MDTSALIDQILVFAFTFTANLFASVSGGGAGFVQFPLLILMGLPFATALGTHKVLLAALRWSPVPSLSSMSQPMPPSSQ